MFLVASTSSDLHTLSIRTRSFRRGRPSNEEQDVMDKGDEEAGAQDVQGSV